MRINTQFKNILIKYAKSSTLTKRQVLQPVVWNEKGLLFALFSFVIHIMYNL